MGGDDGEGGPKGLYSVHPHPLPPPCLPAGRHRRGRGTGRKISNIFGWRLNGTSVRKEMEEIQVVVDIGIADNLSILVSDKSDP